MSGSDQQDWVLLGSDRLKSKYWQGQALPRGSENVLQLDCQQNPVAAGCKSELPFLLVGFGFAFFVQV